MKPTLLTTNLLNFYRRIAQNNRVLFCCCIQRLGSGFVASLCCFFHCRVQVNCRACAFFYNNKSFVRSSCARSLVSGRAHKFSEHCYSLNLQQVLQGKPFTIFKIELITKMKMITKPKINCASMAFFSRSVSVSCLCEIF